MHSNNKTTKNIVRRRRRRINNEKKKKKKSCFPLSPDSLLPYRFPLIVVVPGSLFMTAPPTMVQIIETFMFMFCLCYPVFVSFSPSFSLSFSLSLFVSLCFCLSLPPSSYILLLPPLNLTIYVEIASNWWVLINLNHRVWFIPTLYVNVLRQIALWFGTLYK